MYFFLVTGPGRTGWAHPGRLYFPSGLKEQNLQGTAAEQHFQGTKLQRDKSSKEQILQIFVYLWRKIKEVLILDAQTPLSKEWHNKNVDLFNCFLFIVCIFGCFFRPLSPWTPLSKRVTLHGMLILGLKSFRGFPNKNNGFHKNKAGRGGPTQVVSLEWI